jgi:hypothetical protein
MMPKAILNNQAPKLKPIA